MTTKQIDCALELSKTLNFRRAAENLYISQPALSYQIQSLEDEVGFQVFIRSGKGVVLTAVGEYFCRCLSRIQKDLSRTVIECQTMSSRYAYNLNVCLGMRNNLQNLTGIIKEFGMKQPDTSLHVRFIYDNEQRLNEFLQGKIDIIFGLENALKQYPDVATCPLFYSYFYLIVSKTDPLAKMTVIHESDLVGRTLLIGPGSPPELEIVQKRVLRNPNIHSLVSSCHESALTKVSADLGIVLCPDMAWPSSDEFVWIPFDCPEKTLCSLGYHRNDTRESTQFFIDLARKFSGYTGRRIRLQ